MKTPIAEVNSYSTAIYCRSCFEKEAGHTAKGVQYQKEQLMRYCEDNGFSGNNMRGV